MAKSLIENITIGRFDELEPDEPWVQFSVWYQGTTFSTIYASEESVYPNHRPCIYDEIAISHKFIEFYDSGDLIINIPDMVKKKLNEMTASRGYPDIEELLD